jgi:hypothetical protein
MTRSRRNLVVAVLLVLGLAAGLVLVLTGGDEESASTTTSAVTTTAPEVDPLPLEDTSQAALEELTGLVVPAEATGFLTARLDDDRQLDMTFVMPAASVPAFIAASGLPQPVADERVVIHSSPLWKLNPTEGAALSGVSDSYGTVDRSVELVTEADGTVRARIVVTPTA